MSNRIAFFGDADDLIERFDLHPSGELVFNPHYNMARGYHIPALIIEGEQYKIVRTRWGKKIEKNGAKGEITDDKYMAKLEKESSARALIPASGFFVWKDEKKKDHPFFIRRIDNELLYIAGHVFEGDSEPYIEMLTMESNTLIQPISTTMPLIMKETLGKKWLNDADASGILKEASRQFLITELTVHRVTKKVKDESENEASLIQPIPK